MGLAAGSSGALLPAPAAGGGWTTAPWKTVEFGIALRALLRRGDFAPEDLAQVGAHSLKATALSWAAKAGIERNDRRTLGYHLKVGDRVMEAYSRDAMAGPLRQLDRMLEDIRAKRFDPDATRSGMLSAAGAEPAAAPAEALSSSCSSRASSEPSLAESDEEARQQAAEEDCDLAVVQNLATRFCHRMDGDGLACGKPLPLSHAKLADLPAGGRLCSICF